MTTFGFEQVNVSFFKKGQDRNNPKTGLVMLGITQNVQVTNVNWSPYTIGEVVSNTAGQTIAFLAFSQFLLAHYQTFAFNKSNIKRLYFEERKRGMDENDPD